jgi:phosphopantothenoylcysteine decarboxylase/phosphopantothenate--cysteine ligase
MKLNNKKILLIISGGIAAYKSLDLIRQIKKAGAHVQCVLTKAGSEFVTPLSVSALSENKCYMDLWNLTDESEMGHIRLSREADLVIVTPATANIIAKMTHGMADDLATTTLLATNKPVMVAPAMNPCMWDNAATQDNVATLRTRGITILDPQIGKMACGETGQGRMVEPDDIMNAIENFFFKDKPLSGKHALVTSGPTFEPIDPVRFIGNRSSGKQGHAIAIALRDQGAIVTLVSGPTALPDPDGIKTIPVETAVEMMNACVGNYDIAVCAAAVADYGVVPHTTKQKKSNGALDIELIENPDILQTISTSKNRPSIVIGFAAETENLVQYAKEKLLKKSCDAIVANMVGNADNPVFGNDTTSIHWITKSVNDVHENLSKSAVATILTDKIIEMMSEKSQEKDKAA